MSVQAIFAGWDIATANQIAANRHFVGLVSEQSIYNLENRMIELEVLPACRHYGLGVIPWSPLAGGLLGGVLNGAKEGRRAREGFDKRIAAKRLSWSAGKRSARKSAKPPQQLRWPGCSTKRASQLPS